MQLGLRPRRASPILTTMTCSHCPVSCPTHGPGQEEPQHPSTPSQQPHARPQVIPHPHLVAPLGGGLSWDTLTAQDSTPPTHFLQIRQNICS